MEQVARALGWSVARLCRIEIGVVIVSATDLRLLLAEYHADNAETVEELTAMARAAKSGRWSDYPESLTRVLREPAAPLFARDSEDQQFKPIPWPSRKNTPRPMYVLAIPISHRIQSDLSELLKLCRERENVSVTVVPAMPSSGLRGPFVLLELGHDGYEHGQQLDFLDKHVQQLAFLLTLLQVWSWLMLTAELRRSLQPLAFVPFSRQISARDRIARSSRSLRGPTCPRVPCPARGMAIAA